MDDSSAKMRANMERVLRAMDVIPPLGSGGRKADRPDAGRESAEDPSAASDFPVSAEPPEETAPIPQFDLGEKILAEQRRLTATRRKAPGATVSDAGAEAAPPLRSAFSDEDTLQQRLPELQRIVADIVARDIERLCPGPAVAAT